MDQVLDVFFVVLHEVFYINIGKQIFGAQFALRSERVKIPAVQRFALGLSCFTASVTVICTALYIAIQLGAPAL